MNSKIDPGSCSTARREPDVLPQTPGGLAHRERRLRQAAPQDGPVGTLAGVEPLHVGLLLTDAQGCVRYADCRWSKLMRRLDRGEPWTRAVADEDRGWVESTWRDCREDHLTFCAEFRSGAPGQPRWVRACAVHGLDVFDDGVPGWTWHFADCTLEYRLGERLARANEALEAAHRRNHELFASTRRELQAPAAAILALAQAVEQPAAGALSDRQRDVVRAIKGSSSHLLQVIESLRDS